ncbi:hypothetical protein ACPW96_19365 [Micromonospora sp. DT81.3]|uniref:hypothetical protein n=1 Tax=Micromonospora sp. DT81.3 TaxID=3416523 RepID=UPI003CFA39E9
MKKLVVSLVVIAALALTGCGGTDAPSANTATTAPRDTPSATAESQPVEEPPAPDLTGSWKQSNSQSETDFMTATIADAVISVEWELGSADITAVYWVGTFVAPGAATDPYIWTSQRDVAATDTAVMASSDATKDFTFSGGIISFTVTVQGESATVEMAKN